MYRRFPKYADGEVGDLAKGDLLVPTARIAGKKWLLHDIRLLFHDKVVQRERASDSREFRGKPILSVPIETVFAFLAQKVGRKLLIGMSDLVNGEAERCQVALPAVLVYGCRDQMALTERLIEEAELAFPVLHTRYP